VSGWQRSLRLLLILGGHGLLLLGLTWVHRPDVVEELQTLSVRLLETSPPAPLQPARPLPPPPRQPPVRLQAPPPVLASNSPAASPVFSVPAQPEPRPLETPAPPPVHVAPAPAPLQAARFDADYLQNPKPAYPPLSRRLGEEGRVVLRVRVSAQGLPIQIEIKQSSTFPRLDDAARAAVERWRFIPARQGSEAVDSWVLVPLSFGLVAQGD
jgi:protein TonB